jgi:hypothetical protein
MMTWGGGGSGSRHTQAQHESSKNETKKHPRFCDGKTNSD